MKKILLLILAVLFIAAGCGQNKETKEEKNSEKQLPCHDDFDRH